VVTLLAARSISRPVWEGWQARPSTGQVRAVFERACHLGLPAGGIVALVLPELGNGPLNVVVEGEPGLFATIAPGAFVYRDRNQLQVGDLQVNLDRAVIWEPRPAWKKLRACGQAIAGHLPLVHALALRQAPQGSLLALLAAPLAVPLATSPAPAANECAGRQRQGLEAEARSLQVLARLTHQAAHSLAAGLQTGWDGDQTQLQAGAARLAGLGGGLTPAGDDFLVGAMLWVWLTCPTPEPLCQMLLEAAAPRTTALSAAFLQAAARGECSASWHALLAVLAEGTDADLAPAVQAVLAHGYTSGADTLAGFLCMGLSRSGC
jgi:hypothetical protein